MEYLFIAVFSQILLVFLLFRREILKKDNEKFLWIIILIAAFTFGLKFVFLIIKADTLYKSFSPAIVLAMPPLLFVYVESVVKYTVYPKKRLFLHLLPTIILTIFFLIVGIMVMFFHRNELIVQYKRVYDVFYMALNFCYYPFTLYLIVRNRNNHYIHLKWLIIPSILWILSFVMLFLIKYVNVAIPINLFLCTSIFGFVVFLVQILRKKYASQYEKQLIPVEPKQESTKYEKSSLKEEDVEKIIESLHQYMQDKKPFLDSDFSLSDLSVKLNISKHHITEVLNTSLEKNFFLFVNEYRTKEAKNRMQKNKEDNLQTIAYSSGFNSKTTFIKYFKQIEGITPSDFRRNTV
ncbi:helix-turn-helix domain-containing protein [Pedobacter sp. MW01-1-1]|uniref:helix-turn-helix domain-containing protein n=1 Tax=Pedobacter sp. MW01-1-1 TaxID=3383027 RepID=UPI003FF0F087